MSVQQIATSTATLVARHTGPDLDTDGLRVAFERAVDARPVLRRLGTAEVVVVEPPAGPAFELRCRVAYGPVRGNWASDLRRQLAVIAPNAERAVFGFDRRVLRSADDLRNAIAELDGRVADAALPLAARLDAERKLTRLRGWLANIESATAEVAP